MNVLTPNAETDSRGPASPEAIRKEILRKLFHLNTILYLAAYLLLGPARVMGPMLAWTAAVLALELARFHTAWGRSWTQRAFGAIIREKESKHYTGVLYTTIGALAVFAFFRDHPRIVKASLCYLAFGDSASAVVGLAWGRHPYWIWGRKRTWEGSLAGFAAALLVGAATGLPPAMVLAGALAFCVADILPLPPDDNVWIPVLPGTILLAAQWQ
ncbi:MAG: hypothetical protein HY927_02695 [Elusimicrobia bacterium]|nr:hypothetical protein [Elusimicrobiota bacterium]